MFLIYVFNMGQYLINIYGSIFGCWNEEVDGKEGSSVRMSTKAYQGQKWPTDISISKYLDDGICSGECHASIQFDLNNKLWVWEAAG